MIVVQFMIFLFMRRKPRFLESVEKMFIPFLEKSRLSHRKIPTDFILGMSASAALRQLSLLACVRMEAEQQDTHPPSITHMYTLIHEHAAT